MSCKRGSTRLTKTYATAPRKSKLSVTKSQSLRLECLPKNCWRSKLIVQAVKRMWRIFWRVRLSTKTGTSCHSGCQEKTSQGMEPGSQKCSVLWGLRSRRLTCSMSRLVPVLWICNAARTTVKQVSIWISSNSQAKRNSVAGQVRSSLSMLIQSSKVLWTSTWTLWAQWLQAEIQLTTWQQA